MEQEKIRHIRVFISSTFKDMQAERDIIVKKVFPRFRIESEKRGISFSYVDLRWGVKPNARPKEIIDTCLSEIKNCEPFFIGLIGYNYGSIIPDLDNAEIVQLEKSFNGVYELIQNGKDKRDKRLGYTELEMRYNLLYSKDKSRNFFYIKDDSHQNKGCLFSLIPQIGNWSKCSRKDTLLVELKEFVHSNYPKTISPYPSDTTYEKSEGLETPVYNDLMSIIKDDQIPYFPQETFVRNNQEFYLEKQNELFPRSFVEVVENWVNQDFVSNNDSVEILLLKGELGSGRTSVLAEYLNKQHPCLNVLYHFVGVSLKRETPELILKDLIAQICSCLGIREPLYPPEETRYDLRQYLTEYLLKSEKKNVIVIDDIEEIECDVDSLISILSWLPTKNSNLKYVFSLSNNGNLLQHCPDWINKTELTLDELTPNDCYNFSQKYLLQKYRKDLEGKYGKEKIELLSPDFFGNEEKSFLRNLGVLKLFLDEIAMLDFGEDKNGHDLVKSINEKSIDKHVVLSLPLARIENEIFIEDWGKAIRMLSYLSLVDYGLYENDIISVCSDSNNTITQVDWSKLYSQIKPFLVSEGYIKLSPAIKNLIIDQYFLYRKEMAIRNMRIKLAKRLEIVNNNNNYTIEIINQYLKGKDCIELKRFLASPQIITYVFKYNKDYLFEALKALKAQNQSENLAGNLMASIGSLNVNIQLHLYETVSEIFTDILPVYDVALEAIHNAISILRSINNKENDIELAKNYLKKTRLLTTLYRFEDAFKSIEDYFQILSRNNELSEDISVRVEGLITKAKIYTHNPSTTEKLKAIPIYQYAIAHIDKNDKSEYISLLHNIGELYGYYQHNKDAVMQTKELMSSYIMDNFIFGTQPYYKALKELRDIEYLVLKLNSDDINDYQHYCKKLTYDIRKYTEIYGLITRDTAGFYWLIEKAYSDIAYMYYNTNNYSDFVINIDNAAYYNDLCKEVVDAIFPNYTKAYSNAVYELARCYQSFIEIRPIEKEIIIQKCLSWYLQVENILMNLFPNGCWDQAKAYHNISSIYLEKGDFDTAKHYIENAIKIKRRFIDINEKSLHDSYIRKLIIYKKEIVEKEIHNVEILNIFRDQISELLVFTKNNIVLSEQEKDCRIQEILQYQTWLDNWRSNSKECYYNHAKYLLEVEIKMLKDYHARNLGKDEWPKLMLLLLLQSEKLNSYIAEHQLQTEFDKNETYRDVMSKIQELLYIVGLSDPK